ncbi:hypothetical protein ACWD7T_34385 [Streptomyces sp. 900116325]
MESEVIAALIGTPAVLVTAAAAWLAGRAQSRGAYHGPVDAVRRTAQREAYANLFRSAHQFIRAWEAAEEALTRIGPLREGAEVPPDVRELSRQMLEAQNSLEHAADMVRLEGPESLAEIAERIWRSTAILGGQYLGPRWGRTAPLFDANLPGPAFMVARNEAMTDFTDAHSALLPTARQYLNGGPSR